MAKTSGRRVVQRGGGRQSITAGYNRRAWYQLPDWAAQWLVANSYWVAAIFSVLLAPAAVLAIFLGVKTLPLEFLGVPSSDNGAGLAVVMLILKFVFVTLAIRPLRRRQIRGWYWLMAAAAVHMAHSYVLQHGISGTVLFVGSIYLYWQVRRWY